MNKKTAKRMVCCLLTAVLGVVPLWGGIASAAQTAPDAALYEIYGDGMLFQHNEPATLGGTAKAGSKITCTLRDAEQKTVAAGESIAAQDGTFSLTFEGQKGGYGAYSLTVCENGEPFVTLQNVVFGEQWLAGGQSNMHWFLGLSQTGMEMQQKGEHGSPYLRFLDTPLNPTYKGSDSLSPLEPQKDIKGAQWFDGTSDKIFGVSAVAYFFAAKLQKELDMPVGILCNYLGGTSIATWLSREAVDSTPAVKKAMKNYYVPAWKWDETENYNAMNTVSLLYNKKTAPLTAFRLAGMIWYQGESDSMQDHGYYTDAFNLLQSSYSKDFRHENGALPAVISLVANNMLTGTVEFQKLNAEYGEIQRLSPKTRAIVSINDLPLTYTQESQTCHPIDKQPIGERMATAAYGLVYKGYATDYAAPVFVNAKAEKAGITVTFANVGEGLTANGTVLRGFTLCEKDGVYLPADATITGKNTVFVSCESMQNPVAVMYGQGLITTRCNLYSTRNGEVYLPACPLVSDWSKFNNIWQDFGWTDCDTATIWREENLKTAGYYDVWGGMNAAVTVSPQAAQKGDAGLFVQSKNSCFSVYPETHHDDIYEGGTLRFIEFNKDWSGFGTLSVMLKNQGTDGVTLNSLRITTAKGKTMVATVAGTNSTAFVLPPDGIWHKVTFDLSDLRFADKNSVLRASNRYLSDVEDVVFVFSCEKGADICMDNITFTANANPMPKIYLGGIPLFHTVLRWFSGLFSK